MLRCRKKNPPHLPHTVIKLDRSLTSKNLSLSLFFREGGKVKGLVCSKSPVTKGLISFT